MKELNIFEQIELIEHAIICLDAQITCDENALEYIESEKVWNIVFQKHHKYLSQKNKLLLKLSALKRHMPEHVHDMIYCSKYGY